MTFTETESVESPPRPSETVSRKVRTTSFVSVGATNVGDTVVAPVSETVGPAVWAHVNVNGSESGSELAAPVSTTPSPPSTV